MYNTVCSYCTGRWLAVSSTKMPHLVPSIKFYCKPKSKSGRSPSPTIDGVFEHQNQNSNYFMSPSILIGVHSFRLIPNKPFLVTKVFKECMYVIVRWLFQDCISSLFLEPEKWGANRLYIGHMYKNITYAKHAAIVYYASLLPSNLSQLLHVYMASP